MKKKIVIVSGMHRSGTSMLTKALELLSVNMGSNLMLADESNEKGYMEDLDFVEFNDNILWQIGHRWDGTSILKQNDFEKIASAPNIKNAINLISDKIDNVSCLGVKDPRFSKIFPFWKIVFQKINISVFYVIAIRNPLAVALSLKRRDGFDFDKSFWLWASYSLQSSFYTSDCNPIYVEYENMLRNPKKEIIRLSKSLGMNLIGNLDKHIASFIDPRLNHYSSFNQQELAEISTPLMIAELYAKQKSIASDSNYPNDIEYKSFLNRGMSLMDYISPLMEKTELTKPLMQRIEILEKKIVSIQNSNSWKITHPFRLLDGFIRGYKN